MITNFEKITHELNEYEKNEILPIMLNALSYKVGVENVVSNKQMKLGLKTLGYKVNDVRIRKLIHYIRVKKLIKNLIANSKGYYIATEKIEIDNFIESLQQRVNSIETVRQSFIKK
tara:strand:- start:42 stop:389 length:348 start_codon:yes stop_codon:yes gene_type:complete